MKKFITITISLIILIPNIISVVNAQEFKCADVQTDTTGFYVILEEPLGGPDAKYCFRVCNKVIDGSQKERICDLRDECKGGGTLKEEVTCQRVQVLQAKGGLDLLQQYIRLIYLWSAGIIGIISVLVIVISGIQIMMGEKSGALDEAKGRIGKSLLGLVILFLAGLILYTINPTFFV